MSIPYPLHRTRRRRYRRHQPNPGGGSNQYWNQNDGLTGSQLAELMMGSSSFSTGATGTSRPYGWNQAAYVMDDWKVNTKFTVQLGLRWDHDGARRAVTCRAA